MICFYLTKYEISLVSIDKLSLIINLMELATMGTIILSTKMSLYFGDKSRLEKKNYLQMTFGDLFIYLLYIL